MATDQNIHHSIPNFRLVTELLACAGQPSEDQLTSIAADGYQTIINLGLTTSKYALPDEASSVNGLGLTYYHIPVVFDSPQIAELKTFITLMNQHKSDKTLVHCIANYRASTFTGLYLLDSGQLKQEELNAFIEQIWQPDPVWRLFIDKALSSYRITAKTTG